MMAKVIFTLVALALQYLLLHSHKTGPSPWIWIASTSAVLMLVGVSSLRVVASGGWLFALLLLWLRHRSARLLPKGTSNEP